MKQCYFSTVDSGILLGGQKLRQCSFFKSLLQYSFGRFENCMVLSYSVLGFACMVCTYLGPGAFEYVANS